ITFDGSNTAGGSTRNLVLVNSSYAGGDVHSSNSNDYTDRTVLWLASNDTDGVTNVTVKNVQIKQTYKNNPDRYCVGIFAGTNAIGQSNMLGTGEANGAISNITINGNDFVNVKEGIYFNGGTTNISTNVTIFDNDLGSENNQESVLSPIALNNVNTFNIYENYIYKLYRDTNAASLATGGITINGLSRNGNIYKNDIKDLKRPTANQQILAGIVLNSSYSQDNNIKVYNNFILDVSTLGNSGGYSNGYGIVVDQGTGYKIYHNTVVLTPASNQTVNERNYSAALYVSAGVTALDVRNNIFVNTQTSPLTEKFAIIVNSPSASTFSYLNYNNLYSTQYIGFYGTTAGLTAGNNPNYYATFDGWQNNTLKDANSKNVNPAFASATDLHINAYSTQNNGFVDAGTPAIYSIVSKDIDGQVRKTSAPDMGADEFGQIAAVTPGTSPGLANNPGITCDSSTTWNGTAQGWSNGLPEIGKDVIFNADFTQSGGTLEACSIYVLAGKSVNVSGSATVTVNHSVNVETTGFLTFASSAHLIQLTDDQNTGIATVKRNSGLLQKLDYTIWSAPVTDARTSGFQSLQAFSPATLSNRFYYYNTPVNAYTPYATPETVKFIKGKGLLIRMPNTIAGNTTYNNGTSRVVWEGSFEGTPNNGTIRIPLEYTSDANSYNAVGNPYPSPIDIKAFINENAGNSGVITGTLWLWRKTNDTNLSSYATVNLTAYAANSGGNNGGNTLIEDPYLVGNGTFNTAQGFIVKATAPNKELVFKNNMRNATGHSSAFFRTNNNEDGTTTTTDGFEGDRVWLNVKNAGTFSQAVIAYSPNTTNGYDNGYDGEVLVSGNLNLYSMLTTEAGVSRMTIQAKNTFNDTDVVPMGYIASVAGTYEIEIDHTDGVFAQGQDVYLKDNMLGTTQKLNSGSYSFTTETGTFNGRFEVVYKAQGQLGTDIPVVDAKDVIAYRDGNQIKVTSTEVLASVSVYDVLGKKLFTKNNIGSTEFATADLNIAQQVVIINITLDNNQVISKKIMMN
ncbi:MAG: T9SS sorting signal type C domain-containing protein, partial [Sphingobacteriales bacterium]